MNSPRRRIWIYTPDTREGSLEVVVLGKLDEIGMMFALLKNTCERWPGWRGVAIIGAGTDVGILRMDLAAVASSIDPIAEWFRMWLEKELPTHVEWAKSDNARLGAVATW